MAIVTVAVEAIGNDCATPSVAELLSMLTGPVSLLRIAGMGMHMAGQHSSPRQYGYVPGRSA